MAKDRYSSLRTLLDQFGRGGKRRSEITEGDELTREKCRLEICNEVMKTRQGHSRYDSQLLIKSMSLLFPRSYNPNGRMGCGSCVAEDLKRIEWEANNLPKTIEKLGGTTDSQPINATTGDSVSKATPEPVKPMYALHVGFPAYIVTGQHGEAGLSVGIVVQMAPQILVRILDRINSMPQEVAKDRIFSDLRVAHDYARALHGGSLKETGDVPATQMQPGSDETPNDPSNETAPTESDPTERPEGLPKKNDILDNGDIQGTVTRVAAGMIYMTGEIRSITYEQFTKEWAILPK